MPAHRWHNSAHECRLADGDTGDLMMVLGWASDDMPAATGRVPRLSGRK